MSPTKRCGDGCRNSGRCSPKNSAALVLGHCDPNDGVWHVRPIFWLPADRLGEKAARDHAPYVVWAARGYLETTPGAAIGYEFVAARLKEIFEITR